jgi:hypothetical protein
MTVESALAEVEQQIAARLKAAQRSRKAYRRVSRIQAVSAATLAAVTTFLIGLNEIYDERGLGVAALASGALTTIAGAAMAWFGSQPLWVANQKRVNDLHALRSKIAYDRSSTEGGLSEETVDGYYDRLQAILDEGNAAWEATRSAGS